MQYKKNDLISQYRFKYIMIDGDKGAGKTSLKTALQAIFYQRNKRRERKFIKFKLWQLKGRGFSVDKDIDLNNNLPQHAIYDTDDSILKRKGIFNRKEIKTHDVNFDEIRMPNNVKQFRTFLPYAVISSSEIIDIANNNKTDQIDITKYEFNKKQRHAGITQLVDTQDGETVAKWQRRFIDILIYVIRREDAYIPFTSVKYRSTWTIWVYETNRVVRRYGFAHTPPVMVGEKEHKKAFEFLERKKYIHECKITFYGNINKYYIDKNCEGEFFANLDGFKLETKSTLNKNYTAGEVENLFQEKQKQQQIKKK